MASRLTLCPECKSTNVDTVKLHNPNTGDLNCHATLRCNDCEHQWEGRVTSPRVKRLRAQGRLR